MILCVRDLKSLGRTGWLVQPYDETLVNPASIDIRIGNKLIRESDHNVWITYDLGGFTERFPHILPPGHFVLIETMERIVVPNGYAIDCKLKSTRARQGFDHSLAFWFDPGWSGVGTFEVRNVTRYQALPIWPGIRFAQLIVHRLSGDAEFPYSGRYQNAVGVEQAKA